jgi:hypothetical protein
MLQEIHTYMGPCLPRFRSRKYLYRVFLEEDGVLYFLEHQCFGVLQTIYYCAVSVYINYVSLNRITLV